MVQVSAQFELLNVFALTYELYGSRLRYYWRALGWACEQAENAVKNRTQFNPHFSDLHSHSRAVRDAFQFLQKEAPADRKLQSQYWAALVELFPEKPYSAQVIVI